jgi:hypothetical protein
MKKMVLKLAIDDEKNKRRAMRAIAGMEGVESVAVDMKEKKITVIGETDPVHLAIKLRKIGFTELLSVGPAKEEKKAEGEKKEEKKPESGKKEEKKAEGVKKEEKKPEAEKKEEKKPESPTAVYVNPGSYVPYPYPYTVVTDEYNPNTCTIC